ncbi:dihydrofolate reductase family protein [Actinomadura flavalba]|uniref:dihydrofolate reductase family protein n=1 Tax=Actinomadura flavalba TaxID=1120938 RepID=UPI00035D1ACB|nr:dihydrofolate reductase family protein [Actinomadura flavalba]
MGKVVAEMTMSLDGFVADPQDGVGPIFDWYDNGDVEVPTPGSDMVWHTSQASAGHLRQTMATLGALVTGRRLYDITGGWDGSHPLGVPVVLVTHEAPAEVPQGGTSPITVVTTGLRDAVAAARELAGDGDVGVGGANVVQGCLNEGLLDEIRVNLAPVLLGDGIPFFAHLTETPRVLDGPRVIEGDGVTHLYYGVRHT